MQVFSEGDYLLLLKKKGIKTATMQNVISSLVYPCSKIDSCLTYNSYTEMKTFFTVLKPHKLKTKNQF